MQSRLDQMQTTRDGADSVPSAAKVDFSGELAGEVGKLYASEERKRREVATERAIAKARQV